MRTLTDMNGKDWKLSLTLGSALKVDQAGFVDGEGTPIKLVGGDPQILLKQVNDDHTVLQILGVLVGDQCENVQTEFYDCINMDNFTQAKYKFWEELADFFPRTRILFLKLVKAQEEVLERSQELQVTAGKRMDSVIRTTMDKAMEEAEASIEEHFSTVE